MYENWLLITAYAGLFILIIAILHKIKRENDPTVTVNVNGQLFRVGTIVKMRYGRKYERRLFRIEIISITDKAILKFIGGKEGKNKETIVASLSDVKVIE